MWVQSLGWEDSMEEGMATHFSILLWRIPWTGEPGGLHGVAKSQARLQRLSTYAYNPSAARYLVTSADGQATGEEREAGPQLSTVFQERQDTVQTQQQLWPQP